MNDSNYRPVCYPGWKAVAARFIEAVLRPLVVAAPPPRGLDAVRRILIVEPFRLGDAALLRGMFEPLRARFPGTEIHLLLHPCAAGLYAGMPDRVHVHAFAFPWVNNPGPREGWMAALRFLRGLRSDGFDIGIDPRGDPRSHAILALAGCAERVGYTNYLASNVRTRGRLLTRSAGDVPLMHRTDIHAALLELLGCLPRSPVPLCPVRGAGVVRRVVLSTGAGWSFRLWPEERWSEIVRWLASRPGVQVRLIGAAAEEDRMRRIAVASGAAPAVVITDLPALLDELRGADLVVCPDSAVMHLASEWFGRPVLALFGPGVVPLYRPRSPGSRVVDGQAAFPCAPCTQQRCVVPDRPCMGSITARDVIRELAGMMQAG